MGLGQPDVERHQPGLDAEADQGQDEYQAGRDTRSAEQDEGRDQEGHAEVGGDQVDPARRAQQDRHSAEHDGAGHEDAASPLLVVIEPPRDSRRVRQQRRGYDGPEQSYEHVMRVRGLV